jgi:hypothetical protein
MSAMIINYKNAFIVSKIPFFIWVFFAVLSENILFSNDPMKDSVEKAQAYFEAEEYDLSLETYDRLLQQNVPLWQKNLLQYDKGTVQLHKEDWNQSINDFRQVALQKTSSSQLTANLKTNYAIALLGSGIEILKTSLKDPNSIQINFEKAIFNFEFSLNILKEAETSECQLMKQEDLDCGPKKDFEELRAFIKINLSKALEDHKHYQLVKSSLKDGVPELLSSIYFFKSWLDFLEKNSLNKLQLIQYVKMIINEMKTWEPLWNEQAEIVNREVDNLNLQQLFSKAKNLHKSALESLEKGQVASTQESVESSLEVLLKFLQGVLGSSAGDDLLKKLSNYYEQALLQTPLQMPLLLQLKTEQEQTFLLMEKETAPKTLKSTLEFATQDLVKTLQFIEQSKEYLARLFLQDGNQWIRRASHLFEKGKEKATVATLMNAIEEQHYAIQLNSSLQQIEVDDSDIQEINHLLISSQHQTIESALPFLPIAYSEQIEGFHGKDLNIACQCKPWDEVLPLFNEGWEEAQQAKTLLQNDSQLAIAHQERAQMLWKKALEKLKAGISAKQEKAKQDKNASSEKTNVPKIEPPSSTNDILRSLQEMDQMDQRPQKSEAVKKGDKPW